MKKLLICMLLFPTLVLAEDIATETIKNGAETVKETVIEEKTPPTSRVKEVEKVKAELRNSSCAKLEKYTYVLAYRYGRDFMNKESVEHFKFKTISRGFDDDPRPPRDVMMDGLTMASLYIASTHFPDSRHDIRHKLHKSIAHKSSCLFDDADSTITFSVEWEDGLWETYNLIEHNYMCDTDERYCSYGPRIMGVGFFSKEEEINLFTLERDERHNPFRAVDDRFSEVLHTFLDELNEELPPSKKPYHY